MKKFLLSFLIFFVLLGNDGCVNSLATKKKQSVSQSVWAIHDSFAVSRVDLAKKYSDESIRLIAPPSVRIKISGIRAANLNPADKSGEQSLLKKITGIKNPSQKNVKVDVEGKYINFPDTRINPNQNVVILPPEFKGAPVVVEDSPEYQKLLSENSALKKQIEKERADFAKVEKKDDKVLIEQDKIVEKAEEKNIIAQHSFWGKVKFWGMIIGGVAGLGALMFFLPAAIPIVTSVFSGFVSLIGGFFRAILGLFGKK